MSEQNKSVVAAVERCWDEDRLEDLDAHFAPDFTTATAVPGLPPGLAGAKLAHQASKGAFPDRRVEVLELIGDGDKVVTLCRMTGTNQGGMPWAGIPANHNAVDVRWVAICTVRDGKIVHQDALLDMATMMEQLGAAPAPA